MSSPVQENGGAYADTDAFAGLVFAISGKFTESHAAISALIRRNAGDIKASVTKAVTHLVSTLDDFNSRSTKVEKALSNGIPIVTERWVRESIEANEALPLRPEFVLHPGNRPLAESEEATKAKASPRTASIDEGRKAELEAPTAAEDLAAAGPAPVIVDESKLPSAAVTMAKDASLPVLHPTIGAMHPTEPPAAALAPTEAQAPAPAQAAPSTVVPPPVEQLPTAVQPAATSPEAETQRIEATAAAAIPPVPAPSHEALVEAARANEPMAVVEEAEAKAPEKRKMEETLTPNELPLPLEEPPAKKAKLDTEEAAKETTPTVSAAAAASEETAMPDVLERAPPAESGAGTAAVLPPSQAIPLAAAPPPATDVTPSGAETGGPTSMRETQRAYDLKVLSRREYSPSSAHELSGLIEKQLLEGINVHNDSTEGFGSLADVFARGVDGGAVLVENVRDYAGEDYFNLITYARQGKEFGSVHRNDEVLSCGLLRDGNLSAVRAEDQNLMERLMHVHQPIVPIRSDSASS
jgi:hypothetical protein